MQTLDWRLFKFINQTLANPLFDFILPPIREPNFWIPFYAFLLLFIIIKFKLNGLWIIGAILLTFGLTDQISSNVIKPLVGRIRPCNDLELANQVRLLVGCGGGFSFTSSHATNHFGMATILAFFLGKFGKWIKPSLYIWAGSIAIAQVYVGVHYPGDILGGSVLGILLAQIAIYLYKFFIQPKLTK